MERSLAECKALSESLKAISGKREDIYSKFNNLLQNDYGCSHNSRNNVPLTSKTSELSGVSKVPQTVNYSQQVLQQDSTFDNTTQNNLVVPNQSRFYDGSQKVTQDHLTYNYNNLVGDNGYHNSYPTPDGNSHYHEVYVSGTTSNRVDSGLQSFKNDELLKSKYGHSKIGDNETKITTTNKHSTLNVIEDDRKNRSINKSGIRPGSKSKDRGSNHSRSQPRTKHTNNKNINSNSKKLANENITYAGANVSKEGLLNKFGVSSNKTQAETI